MRRPGGPTINDLARHLGVHKSTVSRAMDPARRHLIGAELLQRVDAAAREIGYRPNRVAAALTTGRSGTIGVLLPDISNPSFTAMLRGITEALDAEGYIAVLASTSRRKGDTRSPQTVVERLQGQCVEGFLIASAVLDDPWLDKLRQSGAHVVLVNRTDGRGDLPAVVNDNRLGMRLAVDHLVSLGHRHVAHLAGPANLSTGRERRAGFEEALRAHGLEPGPIVECENFKIEAGRAAMVTLLAPPPGRGRRGALAAKSKTTAVVAANDMIALGALQTLKERDVAVPRQMSIVGHNDMQLLEQVCPPLSTVRIQNYEMGHRAARLLLESLKGAPGSDDATIVLRPQLVVRESTAPPP
jgi:LacI family transcriptional regulator